MGWSDRTIKRLVDAEFLTRYTIEHGGPRRYGSVRQDEVLTLRLKWRKPIPLKDAAKWLGLTKSIVVDLVRVGLLTTERNPGVDGSEQWMFGKQSLDKCYCAVTQGVRPHGMRHSNLARTARALSAVGLRVADILRLVADGELECWSYAESPALAKPSFDSSDVEALLERPKSGKELLRSEKAARRLGVAPGTLFRWTRDGLLLPVVRYAYEEYFDLDEIDNFLTDYVSSKEAADMLEVGVEDMVWWSWEWGLEAVKGTRADGHPLCLFLRKDVEQLLLQGWPDQVAVDNLPTDA